MACGGAHHQAGSAASAGEVDISTLTARGRADYGELTRSLLAPCAELPLSIAECLDRHAACGTCEPAAVFLRDSIGRGHTPAQAEAAFRLRFDPKAVSNIDVANSPTKGEANAPVVIVEWADFECPFCARASSLVDDLIKSRAGRAKVVFKFYPLAGHPHGELTAYAAAAAELQGKFWPMHDQLFANQTSLDEQKIREIAKAVGLDMARFDRDWVSDEVKAKVEQDRTEADRLGLQGTPFIWVNGRHVDSKYFGLEEDLPAWIDLEWELASKKQVSR